MRRIARPQKNSLQATAELSRLADVRLGRRAFLRLLSSIAAAGLLRPRASAAGESAIGIHRATRNTLLGAIGDGLRKVRSPLPPFKAYEGKPRVSLGDVPRAGGPSFSDALARRVITAAAPATPTPGSPSAVLSRDQLARLLYFTNGDTGRGDGEPYKLRAAPSAGALYAGEIYVLASSVDGLDRGIYYYDVGKHELVTVQNGLDAGAVDQAFETDGASGAAALVCIANVFERYELRYANRGYRYALIDTGHIGENLALVSSASGVPCRGWSRFDDDRLNTLLGLEGREDAVCAIYAVGGSVLSDGPVVRHFVEKGASGTRMPKDLEPTVRYHEASKLLPGAAARPEHGRRRAAKETRPFDLKVPNGERIALDAPTAAPSKTLQACIAERRSPSRFAARAITTAQLAAICRAAQPAAMENEATLIEVLLVCHRVEGVDGGLYSYLPREEKLVFVRRADFRESLPRVCLGQSKAGDAAVGVLMIGRLRQAALHYGERSYRDVLIEAGRIGERVYLAAEALDLRARNLAAFLDEDLDELIGADGRERSVVHLTMVGYTA